MWQTIIVWDKQCQLQTMFAIDTYVIGVIDVCDNQFDKVIDATQRYQIISKLAKYSQLSEHDIMVSIKCIDVDTFIIRFLDRSNQQLSYVATCTLKQVKF